MSGSPVIFLLAAALEASPDLRPYESPGMGRNSVLDELSALVDRAEARPKATVNPQNLAQWPNWSNWSNCYSGNWRRC
jgi:hypothetical protein